MEDRMNATSWKNLKINMQELEYMFLYATKLTPKNRNKLKKATITLEGYLVAYIVDDYNENLFNKKYNEFIQSYKENKFIGPLAIKTLNECKNDIFKKAKLVYEKYKELEEIK